MWLLLWVVATTQTPEPQVLPDTLLVSVCCHCQGSLWHPLKDKRPTGLGWGSEMAEGDGRSRERRGGGGSAENLRLSLAPPYCTPQSLCRSQESLQCCRESCAFRSLLAPFTMYLKKLLESWS